MDLKSEPDRIQYYIKNALNLHVYHYIIIFLI